MRTYTSDDLVRVLRGMVSADRTRTDIARDLGFSSAYIGNVMNGGDPLSEKLANAMGYEKLPDRYVKVGKSES